MKSIAIVGNPNCGKTTLFNLLTGLRQRVGNWSGVTVEKKEGIARLNRQKVRVIDLPGIYTLTTQDQNACLDEQLACDYILNHPADVYVNIIDASNLKRHLYLTMQLLEMRVPVIVVLNMVDVAKRREINVDCDALSEVLGCPVVCMVANKKRGLGTLKETLCTWKAVPHQTVVTFDEATESRITMITHELAKQSLIDARVHRWTAVRLIEGDAAVRDMVGESLCHFLESVQLINKPNDDVLIANQRFKQVHDVLSKALWQVSHVRKTVTQKLDKVLMCRWLGLPLFFLIMYLMFEFSMNVGTLLQPLFDGGSSALFVQGFALLGLQVHLPPWVTGLLSHGVGLGLNTVITFVPQIGLLFLFLSFLEDSGYMARAAFVMDRAMQMLGLPGSAFVPLMIGFGCNVPAVMATRCLRSRRDRILTALMAPFMSCGARVAIFAVFASAFFPRHAGLLLFCLYVTGIVVAILTGWLLKWSLLERGATHFVMEIPLYHLPSIKNLWISTWRKLRRFLFRAGKVIVPVCVIVGGLNAVSWRGELVYGHTQDSVLAQMGRSLTVLFRPMGVREENWPATVGLLTGTLAKEVVVGTLNTLYTQQRMQPAVTHEDASLAGRSRAARYAVLPHATSATSPLREGWGLIQAGLHQAWRNTWRGFRDIFSQQQLNPLTANEAAHSMTRTAMGVMADDFHTVTAAFAYLLFVLLYIPCVSTMATLAKEIGAAWAWFSIVWSIEVAYTVSVVFYQIARFDKHPIGSLYWVVGLMALQGVIAVSLKCISPSIRERASLRATEQCKKGCCD